MEERNKNIDKLKAIAKAAGADLKENPGNDDVAVSFAIAKGGRELHILFTNTEGIYLASDLSSHHLPRELYSDTAQNQFTEEQRSNEIITTVGALLNGQITYYKSPWLLNKNRGYLLLQIDGRKVKIKQSRNYFNLPIS